jgi:serine phosphatase RsbU (regulator of sigma subunit)/sensor domain CHASE-containing protein
MNVKMTIKVRVILIFCVAIGILIIAENAILNFFILREFSNTERLDAARNLERLISLIDERSAKLISTAHDWSYWDDTYKFVTAGDPDYIPNNIFDSTFINLRVNGILIFDANDSLCYGGAFDLDRGNVDTLPHDIIKVFGPQSPHFKHYSQTRESGGIILLDRYPCLFAASPIMPSVEKKKPAGTIILLSYLTESAIAQLSKILRVSACIHPLDRPFVAHNGLHQQLAASDSIKFSIDGHDLIRTEKAISDVSGKKCLLVSISQPRVIYRQGQRMFMTINALVVIATLLLVILLFMLLQNVVVKRITRLSKEITSLGKNSREAVTISGSDEISMLAEAINGNHASLRRTIASLNKSEKELQSANKKLAGALAEINNDLVLARRVQNSLLPGDLSGMPGLTVAAYYLPSAGVSGDLYDVVSIDQVKTALLVSDVSGHGAAAALYGTRAKAEFSRYLETDMLPREIFSHVHANLVKIGGTGRYCTAFLCIFDSMTRRLVFARAGHPPAMLLRRESGTVENLTGKGSIIGMAYDAAITAFFDEATVTLDKGDRLLLYTDGVVECIDASEKPFGKNNLEQTLKETCNLEPQAVLAEILARVERFCGRKSFEDDLTLVMADVL